MASHNENLIGAGGVASTLCLNRRDLLLFFFLPFFYSSAFFLFFTRRPASLRLRGPPSSSSCSETITAMNRTRVIQTKGANRGAVEDGYTRIILTMGQHAHTLLSAMAFAVTDSDLRFVVLSSKVVFEVQWRVLCCDALDDVRVRSFPTNVKMWIFIRKLRFVFCIVVWYICALGEKIIIETNLSKTDRLRK